MVLRRLSLRNFRNYSDFKIELSKSLNIFYGNNAQGKSNLLEAIHLLGLTRSFRTNSDRDLIKYDCESFKVLGEFCDESQIKNEISINFDTEQGKRIHLDRKRIKNNVVLIGKIPIVQFSPESHRITSGPPSERRRFLDVLLCQSSPSYLGDLQNYNRVLRQRNALLSKANGQRSNNLGAWNHSLAAYGCRIISARYKFIQTYSATLQQAYNFISASSQAFRMNLICKFKYNHVNEEEFIKLLEESRSHEERRKQTLTGPHRDDLKFEIDGKDLKRFGSRGEHKSALMALKMAESEYLKEKKQTAPIILLDDLPSELDRVRCDSSLQYFSEHGQVLVTSLYKMNNTGKSTQFELVNGTVENVNND